MIPNAGIRNIVLDVRFVRIADIERSIDFLLATNVRYAGCNRSILSEGRKSGMGRSRRCIVA
ncbi:MAG: hypothetical protein ABJU46_03230 [Paracoccaceae bacterium]